MYIFLSRNHLHNFSDPFSIHGTYNSKSITAPSIQLRNSNFFKVYFQKEIPTLPPTWQSRHPNGVFTLPESETLIPIPMKLGSMIMCRTVFTEPRLIPIPIPMATVPNLAPISVPIRWNLTNFHCQFCIEIGPSGAFVHFIGIGKEIGLGIRVTLPDTNSYSNSYEIGFNNNVQNCSH